MTADSDGFITIYSVDSDGAYFVRMEFEVLNPTFIYKNNTVSIYKYITEHVIIVTSGSH